MAASTGNAEMSAPLIQQGNILAGPVLGLGTLALTDISNAAEIAANAESIVNAGPGFVNHAVLPTVDFSLGVIGWLTGLCHQ